MNWALPSAIIANVSFALPPPILKVITPGGRTDRIGPGERFERLWPGTYAIGNQFAVRHIPARPP